MKRPYHFSARSGQCDATTSPSTKILGCIIQGSPPLDSRSFVSNDAILVLTRGSGPSSPVAHPLRFYKLSYSMDRRTWVIIARCWSFAGPAEDGGVSRGEIPVGESGSRMARMCHWEGV